MSKPKITAYISSRNYGRYLSEAINSVLRQSTDGWELFLVDDGSADDTRDVMSLYKGDPRVRLLSTPGVGVAAVANLVVKKARGQYVVRVDADDVLDENILLVLGNYLDRHADVALVFPDYYVIDDAGGIMSFERRRTLGDDNHLMDVPPNGACTMIRVDVLRKIGGYREDLKAQDGYDVWTRIAKHHKCANVNLPLFYYRRHGANLTNNEQRVLSARRSIKGAASSRDIARYRPVVAVIPCRRHYDIFPELWNKKIAGKTLLSYAVETCLASSLFARVVVTCDNPLARHELKRYRDPRLGFVQRTPESTIPSCSIAVSLEKVIKDLKLGWGGLTLLCYVQAPFTTTANLEEAVHTLVMHDADSSCCVTEVDLELFRRSANGLIAMNNVGRLRTDFDAVYSDSRTALATKNANIRMGNVTGSKVVNFVVPREDAFFIRSRQDFEIAKILKRLRS